MFRHWMFDEGEISTRWMIDPSSFCRTRMTFVAQSARANEMRMSVSETSRCLRLETLLEIGHVLFVDALIDFVHDAHVGVVFARGKCRRWRKDGRGEDAHVV